METKINQEILDSKNESFLKEYYELLINRVTHSSMALEKDLGDPDNSQNAIRLRDNMRALKRLLTLMPMPLNETLILEIGNIINESSLYISNGYRKIGHYLADTKIPISKPEDIQKDICELLEKYQTVWKNLDCFEREAKFHIAFIRIHPFEDGNGRTARLLLNYNLLSQGIAPVVITNDLTEYYQQYIQTNDVEGMKNILQIQSRRELEIINYLYKENQYSHFKTPRR